MARPISLARLFESYDREDRLMRAANPGNRGRVLRTAMERHLSSYTAVEQMNGHKRLGMARQALNALDRRNWCRSFHQRMFHEEYLKACARIFFKRDPPGSFAREHCRLLEQQGWDATPQEILVSTPRRFGKTILVSMFAAAMMYACPGMELSIYSTCKRISAKLLRNISRFMELIYQELDKRPYKVLRHNQEEVHIQGPEGPDDLRVLNSYPSRIGERPRRQTDRRDSQRNTVHNRPTGLPLP